MKISVIMPCYLGAYEGAASHRVEKFKRAVKSFLAQGWEAELIIVADGCPLTEKVFSEMFYPAELEELERQGTPVRLIMMDKQSHFSGHVRNVGIERATGDIICYLDSDDILGPGHLRAIWEAFVPNPEQGGVYRRWVYFNYFIAGPDLQPIHERHTALSYGAIGTGAIAHEKSLPVRWPDGYGHDWLFVQRLLSVEPHTRKISGPRYLVCHVPPNIDH